MKDLSPEDTATLVAWIDEHDWDCFVSSTGDPDLGELSHLIIRSQAPGDVTLLTHEFYIVDALDEHTIILAFDDAGECRTAWNSRYAASGVASRPEIYEALPELEVAVSDARMSQTYGQAVNTLDALRKSRLLLDELVARVELCLEGDQDVEWPDLSS